MSNKANDPKRWGQPPSPDDVAQQMNAIDKLMDDVEQAAAEAEEARRELYRRSDMLKAARNELGRMLKASYHLENSDFRVLHIDEASAQGVAAAFGIVRME